MKGTIKVTKVGGEKARAKKKVAKKKTAAKQARKPAAQKAAKRASVKTHRKQLVHADASHAFWACTGAVLANLCDLERALEEMTDEEFARHVNAEKNDFANWVESVLGDDECAKALRRAKRRMSARTCVTKRLVKYDC